LGGIMEIKTTFTMRELTFGEILDVGFRLFRRLVWKFVGLFLMVGLPIAGIFALLFLLIFSSPNTIFAGVASVITCIPLLIVAIGIIQGAMIHLTAERYLNKKEKIRTAINFSWSRFSAYFFTAILWGLSILLSSLCLILPGIFVALILSFIFHAVFIDNLSGIDAMKRSWKLFKGNPGKVVGFFFLSSFIENIIGYIPQVSIALLGSFQVEGTTSIIIIALSVITYLIFAFVVFSYIPIVWIVLYFDSRCKIEAFDLEILAVDISKDE